MKFSAALKWYPLKRALMYVLTVSGRRTPERQDQVLHSLVSFSLSSPFLCLVSLTIYVLEELGGGGGETVNALMPPWIHGTYLVMMEPWF
jgi:hypothetical protein